MPCVTWGSGSPAEYAVFSGAACDVEGCQTPSEVTGPKQGKDHALASTRRGMALTKRPGSSRYSGLEKSGINLFITAHFDYNSLSRVSEFEPRFDIQYVFWFDVTMPSAR